MKRSPLFTLVPFFSAAAFALSGCMALGDASTMYERLNSCSSSADCEGGACVSVDGQQMCVATKAELRDLIFEVTTTDIGAPTSYLTPYGGAGLVDENPSGLVIEHDVALSQIKLSSIELLVEYDYKNCPAPGGKLPADFTFYRHAQFAGLPSYFAKAPLVNGAIDTYAITLPMGIYDLHIAPQAQEGCIPPPPTFIPELDLTNISSLPYPLMKPPQRIEGTVSFPKNTDLKGWSIEVVEPKRGLLLSRTQILEADDALGFFAKYSLDFFWDWSEDGAPILRIRPPKKGVDAPSVFFDISALNPNNPSAAILTADILLYDLVTAGRPVEAHVLDTNDVGVASTISFRSAELSGNAGKNATLGMAVETTASGQFKTKLPPGKYQVTASPISDMNKAITTVEWVIPEDNLNECYCTTILMGDKTPVSGTVLLPNGAAAAGGSASIYPSREAGRAHLASLLAQAPPTPQLDSTNLNVLGDFTLFTDPGFVDLRVTPPEGSLYPWLVRSQLKVGPSNDGAQNTDMDRLVLSYPTVVQGFVRDASGATLPGATVRAWLPVSAMGQEGKEKKVVVWIADVSTESNGRFTMPL